MGESEDEFSDGQAHVDWQWWVRVQRFISCIEGEDCIDKAAVEESLMQFSSSERAAVMALSGDQTICVLKKWFAKLGRGTVRCLEGPCAGKDCVFSRSKARRENEHWVQPQPVKKGYPAFYFCTTTYDESGKLVARHLIPRREGWLDGVTNNTA